MTFTVLLIVVGLPFLWSAVLEGLHRLINRGAAPDDATEKRQLLILLAPMALGIGCLLLSRLMPVHLSLPLPAMTGAEAVHGPAAAAPVAQSAVNWQRWVLPAMAAAYLAGFLAQALRLWEAFSRLGRVVRQATSATVSAHPVRVTEAKVPAMAWGRDAVLMPKALIAALSPAELSLVIDHERAHLDRRDPLYFAALGWLDAVLWFNPCVRLQTRRCRAAAELACDAVVTAAQPHLRQDYARALVRVLQNATGAVPDCVPAATSDKTSGDYRMRLTNILNPAPVRRARWFYAAIAVAAVPLIGAQFAWSQTNAPGNLSVVPVEGKITGPYGKRHDPVTNVDDFHRGIDFAVAPGTPIKAAGAGTIAMAGQEGRYGLTVEIDHGHGVKTRYAHLQELKVHWGMHVAAGQEIGTSGNSGASTGPHLHFEVWKNGKSEDPQKVLPLYRAS